MVQLLEGGRRYRVGRSPDCDIHLADARISREHLVLDGTGPIWRLQDRASKNGTRVNGLPASRCELGQRLWVSVGGLAVLVEPVGPDRLQAEREAHSRLRDVVTRVRKALDPDLATEVLLQRSLEAARRLTDCERAALWLVDASGQRSLACLSGDLQPPPSESVIDQIIATGRPVFCSDTSGAESLARRESIIAGSIRALVALPLVREDRAVGVLYADSRQPGKLFTELDLELIASVCDQLRLTLDSAQLRSMIDQLRAGGPKPALSEDSQFRRLLEQVSSPYRAG